jgi:hypothetical protein
MVPAGCLREDAMQVTRPKSMSIFKRYSDLFSEDELWRRQREVQQRRTEWRRARANVVVMPKSAVVQ